MKQWKRYWFGALLLMAGFLMQAAETAVTPPEAGHEILFVTSYNASQYWTNKVVAGFRDYFQQSGRSVAVNVLELDLASHAGLVPHQWELDMLRDQLKLPYNLVVALDNPAADLFLDGRVPVPEKKSLLVLGYDGSELDRIDEHPNTTGLLTPHNSLGSLALGLELLPDTKVVLFLIGGTPDGAVIANRVRVAQNQYPGIKFQVISGYDYSTPAMLAKLAELPEKNSLVIFHHWISGKDKVRQRQVHVFEAVKKQYSGPVFANFGDVFEKGAVGGLLTDPIHFGAEGAAVAERILNGTGPAAIPVHRCKGTVIFDYRQLTAQGISPAKLPEGAVLLNVPHTFWERHSNAVIWSAFCLLLLILSGFGWFWFYLKRRRRQDAIFRAMPIHTAAIDGTGKVHFLHAKLPSGSGPVRTLEDLPVELHEIFRKPIEQVLADGKPAQFEYTYMGGRRRAEVVRLPRDVFGVDTVLWTSADVDELYAMSERFRLTLQAIGDAVIVTDADGVVVLINSSAETMTGFPLAEACGKKLNDIFNIISYIDDKPVPSPLMRALATGKIVELANHTDLIGRDGTRRHIADSASPIRDARGRITGGVLIFRDVTVEYENRDQMRLQSAVLKNIGKIANFSYFRCDSEGIPLFFVREEFWPRRDAKPVPIDAWITPEHRLGVVAAWRDFFTGKTEELYAAYTAGEPRRYYEIRATRSKNPITEKDEFFGLILDVTHIREEEQRHRNDLLLLTSIMDSMQGYIFVKNADDGFRYVMANRKFRDISGIRSEEVIGRSDLEIFAHSPEAMARYRNDDEALLASGGALEIQEVIPLHDGGEIVVQTVKSILTQTDGTRLILGLSLDITQQSKLEQEREKLLEDMKLYSAQERLLNSILEKVTLQTDDDDALQEILRAIIVHLGAMTSYIFHTDFDSGLDIPIAEFWQDNHPKTKIPSLPIDHGAPWLEIIHNHEIFEVPETGTPEAAKIQSQWAQYMPSFGVGALYGTGVWVDKKYWGFMGFSYAKPRTNLTPQEKFLVNSAARMVEIILERRNKRAALDRSEYEKHLILDTMSIPVMLFDPNMKLIRCNNAALAISDLPEEEVYRMGCQEAFCGEQCRSAECPVLRTHDDLAAHTREMNLKGHDYLLRSNPIIIDGKLVYIMKTMIDVTEFNAIRKELTTALEQAQAANKAKSYFLASMSHEIRTPLNAVIGFSELLKGGDLPEEEQREYLDSINLAGNSLLRLINDVLDLSKLEADRTVLTPQPTDIMVLLREVQSIFQFKVQEKNLFFRMDCPAELPQFKVDNLRLRQILLNLIGNAVKFTERGGVTLAVSFHSSVLAIQVRDTGIGITEEAQHRIFEPFVQGDSARDTHVYGGTGLGLAICRRLAERMNGKITLESEVGAGSCFTLQLVNVEVAAEQSNDDDIPAANAVKARNLRVLLVDDVPMNLKVLQAMLRKLNIDSICASSGREALAVLSQEAGCELVLTDLWMPGMDGAELAKRIHENSETATLPIVAITADTQVYRESTEEFLKILYKPVTLESLSCFFDALQFHGAVCDRMQSSKTGGLK